MDDLPQDMLQQVALELPPKDVLNFCLTQKRMSEVCFNDGFLV